jgi:hypothetical protein
MLLIRLIAIFVITTVLAACSGGGSSTSISTPLPGGSVTTTLTIKNTNLASNTTTEVKANFMSGGKPIQGLAVSFSAPPELAIFNPLSGQAITDESGTATVQMTASNSTGVGQVTVSATYGGQVISQIAPFYLNTPSLRLGNLKYTNSVTRGGSIVIEADILDSNGNMYTDQNLDVYFKANYGSFVADNIVGKVRSVAGKVRTTYFSDFSFSPGFSNSSYADVFTITLGTSTLTGNLTINPPAAVNIGYSTSLPAKTNLEFNETMTFTFRVVDLEGNAAPGKLVSFKVSGGGVSLQNSSATTDQSGNAIAIIKAGTASQSGVFVTAYLGNSTIDPTAPRSDSAVISVGPVVIVPPIPVATLALTVSPATAKPGDVITATITYTTSSTTASLADIPVTINSNKTLFIPTKTVVTDAAGKAVVNITVDSNAPAGTVVTLFASSGTTLQSTSTVVTIGAKQPDAGVLTLTTSATPTFTLPATGVVVSDNKATFVTGQGIPVTGQVINFEVLQVDASVVGGTFNYSLGNTANGTDSSGKVLLPTLYTGSTPGTYVVYYKASTSSNGVNYVAYSSQTVTVLAAVTTGSGATVPDPPTAVTGVPAPGGINVTFTVPASPGSSAIIGYKVNSSPLGAVATPVAGAVNTYFMSNLSSGQFYTFTVIAINSTGDSPASIPSTAVQAP